MGIKHKDIKHGLNPYPTYKDSDVEWLGEIPAHWEVKRLKQVCTFEYGDSLATDSRIDGDVQVYGSNGAVGTHECANSLGPCLVIGRKGSFGKVNYSPCAVFAIDTSFFVDRRHTKADLRWLYYMLSDLRLDAATKDSAIPGLDREDAYARRFFLCSPEEQRAIAAFLDRETAKIDALVAKKERLIELLQEKRTSLISDAVTKGLDPDVPLKDSGVEWLGEIPAHWDSKRLKTISRIRYGLGQPPRESSKGLPLIRATNVTRGRITEKDMVYVDPDDVPIGRDAFLTDGEIIVVRSGAYTADSAIIPKTYDGAVTGYDMVVTVNNALAEFVAVALLCTYVRDAQLVISSMRSAQPHLNAEELGTAVILLPPLPEQRAIATFLNRETAKIDALVAKVQEAIDRLKELRTALISAAVTGKIDVREAAA